MLTDFATLLNNDDRETIFEYFEEKLEKYDWCVPLHDWHQNVVDAVISMLFWLKRTKIIQFDEVTLYTRLDELDEESGKFWWAFTLYSPECRGSEEIMEAMGGGDRVFLHQQYSKYFHGNIFQSNTDDLCDLIELCEQLKLGIEFTQYSLSCWNDEKVLSSEPPMFFIFEKNGYANYGHSYFHSTKVPVICEQEVEKSIFWITEHSKVNNRFGIYFIYDQLDRLAYIGGSTSCILKSASEAIEEKGIAEFSKIVFKVPRSAGDVDIYISFFIALLKPYLNIKGIELSAPSLQLPELKDTAILVRSRIKYCKVVKSYVRSTRGSNRIDLKGCLVWNSGNLKNFEWRSKMLEQNAAVENEKEKVKEKGFNVELFEDLEDRFKRNTSINFLKPIPPEYSRRSENVIYLH